MSLWWTRGNMLFPPCVSWEGKIGVLSVSFYLTCPPLSLSIPFRFKSTLWNSLSIKKGARKLSHSTGWWIDVLAFFCCCCCCNLQKLLDVFVQWCSSCLLSYFISPLSYLSLLLSVMQTNTPTLVYGRTIKLMPCNRHAWTRERTPKIGTAASRKDDSHSFMQHTFTQSHTQHTHSEPTLYWCCEKTLQSLNLGFIPLPSPLSPLLPYLHSPACCLWEQKISSLEMHSRYMLSPHQLWQGRVLVLQWKQLTATESTMALTRTNDISKPVGLVAHWWQTLTGIVSLTNYKVSDTVHGDY